MDNNSDIVVAKIEAMWKRRLRRFPKQKRSRTVHNTERDNEGKVAKEDTSNYG